MADIILANEATPSSPSSGNTVIFVNTTTGMLATKNSSGYVRSVGFTNYSTTSQAPAASTRTYITGSGLAIPAGSLQVGTTFRWTFNMTKTAAGSASSTFDIAFGTAGTTADTAQVSFTKPAGTAAGDEATVRILAIVRGPIGATGVVAGQFSMTHNLASTGHATIPCVDVNTISSAFNVSTPTNVGVCITSGASDAITIQMVTAEVWNI